MQNEIVIYQAKELETRLEVRIEDETLWLTQGQIVDLFESSKANINEHIKHIFKSGELKEQATVRKFRTVQKEGNRTVSRDVLHYSLDVIISVGYRVNSIRGTQFRIWANAVLKDHLLNGYSLNKRMNRIEDNVQTLSEKVSEIDFQINTNMPPRQGIFFEGQVFDAYVFAADLVKSAGKSIILIDNYIDETVLALLAKRKQGVKATIYTRPGRQLQHDLKKYRQQYPEINIKPLKHAHDRFLIIDKQKMFHLGASLKDLGKKWFAFSKMNSLAMDVLKKLNENE